MIVQGTTLIRIEERDIKDKECMIPNGIRSIDTDCMGKLLTYGKPLQIDRLILPDSLKVIHERAFQNAFIRVVEAGSGLMRICESAFENSTIEEFKFRGESNLLEIENRAFKSCPNLVKFDPGKAIKRIGDEAFRGDVALQSFVFPATLHTIGDNACEDCRCFTSIRFAPGGCLRTIGHDSFRRCENVVDATFPESLNGIGVFAFAECISLTEVTFGKPMVYFWDGLFYKCYQLKRVVVGPGNDKFPCSITIRTDVFRCCYMFEELVTPEYCTKFFIMDENTNYDSGMARPMDDTMRIIRSVLVYT